MKVFNIFFIIVLLLISCSLNDKDSSNINDWFFDFILNDTIKYNYTDSLVVYYEDDTMAVESEYIKENEIIFIIDSIKDFTDSVKVSISTYTDSEYDSVFYIVKNNVISSLYFLNIRNEKRVFLMIPVLEGVSWNSYGFFSDEYSFVIESIDTLIKINNKWYDDCVVMTGTSEDNDSLFCQYIYSPENGFLQIKYNYIENYWGSNNEIYIKYHKCSLIKKET